MTIKIHVMHTGEVCVSPYLPFGGDDCNIIQASGLFQKKENRIWIPVSVYLIEHPKGLILVDTGWHRDMSPEGKFDKKAQIKSLGSHLLYKINQGKVPMGKTAKEQLEQMGIKDTDLDYILLTHLDCDHANGLESLKNAKNIIVSEDEVKFANKNKMRYNNKWWKNVDLTQIKWNGELGPFNKSYDLFGDGSIELINIPGHCDGLFAVKVNNNGKFVLLFSDGGYAAKSWKEMITSGIAANKEEQKKSLQWIRDESLKDNCIESLANHDPDIEPHVIEL